jgi:quercetin dioxygenase-like cupin family protein
MDVTRFAEAGPYDAPKHFNFYGLRLQGWDVSGSQNFWVGLSHFLPGGGAEMDATPIEKVYVVVDGEVTLTTNGGDTVLRKYDSCRLAPDEARSIANNTNFPASMLVVMPYPDGPR